jgi:putative copper export protein
LLAVRAFLIAVNLLSAAVWVGGFVAIAVVARVARRTLEPAARIAFFRRLGRAYGVVGGGALVVALCTGAALLPDAFGSATGLAAVAAAAAWSWRPQPASGRPAG